VLRTVPTERFYGRRGGYQPSECKLWL
jgi:hypothetical protein